jgi:hypothetical protein
VQVELADRRSVIGWLRYYSDRPENASLFLERASWVREDGGRTEIVGPGILPKSCVNSSISFQKWP